jgi:adenylylsulfate kinase
VACQAGATMDEAPRAARPGLAEADPAPSLGVPPRLETGLTVWLTGLPCAGKTTIANGLAARLAQAGYPVEVLDGDCVRKVLSQELGYSREDRDRNVRRVGWVAELLSRHGVVVICALVSPYRSTRDEVRASLGGRFFEVLVAAPASVCAARDVKGLYARQSAGKMHGLTGVDDPYEPPLHPELVVHSHVQTVEESVQTLWDALPR